MKTLTRKMIFTVLTVASAAVANAQSSSPFAPYSGYGSDQNGYNQFDVRPNSDRLYDRDRYGDFDRHWNERNDDANYRPLRNEESSEFRRRYEHELRRLRDGYDYNAPLSDAVDSNFRRPYSDGYRNDESGYRNRGRLENPFRYPSDRYRQTRRGVTSPSDDRYGFPQRNWQANDSIRPVDYSSGYRGLPSRDFDRNYPDLTGPIDDRRDDDWQSPIGTDPFTPALPRREGGMDVEAIRKAITARYSNPVNVRAVQSMSANQGLALFREVSRQTDSRHLEPSAYDLRVRRGLRNVGVAIDEAAFRRAIGMSDDTFRLDGFRSGLARLESSMQVSSQSDAERVLQTVMNEAQNVPGLNPAIVAFEFANGTIDTLDRFSALEPAAPNRGAALPEDESRQIKSAALESEIVGIGVEVKLHDQGLIILRTLRGGPARDAGLTAGDIITAINDRNIGGLPMANSVDMMTGPSGSQIRLQIVRNGSSRHNVTMVRRSVRIYTVNDSRLLSGTDKVAYLNLTQFGQKSTEEMDQALQQLHDAGMKSLIVDLRGNPGGLLNVCVDITNRFLPCGTIVSTKGRLSSDNMLEKATFNRTWSVPLVVLIDGDSASASEIFAAAVQDNKRGIVVGQKSYGKGTVQTHFPLSSISGNLRLTTARFYSPSGRAMSGAGVTPDVPVEDADGVANGDRVLREAVVIAQSQRLRDIAQAAKQCQPSTSQPLRNSFKKDLYDAVDSKRVL